MFGKEQMGVPFSKTILAVCVLVMEAILVFTHFRFDSSPILHFSFIKKNIYIKYFKERNV